MVPYNSQDLSLELPTRFCGHLFVRPSSAEFVFNGHITEATVILFKILFGRFQASVKLCLIDKSQGTRRMLSRCVRRRWWTMRRFTHDPFSKDCVTSRAHCRCAIPPCRHQLFYRTICSFHSQQQFGTHLDLPAATLILFFSLFFNAALFSPPHVTFPPSPSPPSLFWCSNSAQVVLTWMGDFFHTLRPPVFPSTFLSVSLACFMHIYICFLMRFFCQGFPLCYKGFYLGFCALISLSLSLIFSSSRYAFIFVLCFLLLVMSLSLFIFVYSPWPSVFFWPQHLEGTDRSRHLFIFVFFAVPLCFFFLKMGGHFPATF